MELSNFRHESHVAQQSRRDKLRVQQQSSSISQAQHLEDYSSNLEQLSSVHHQALNPDLIQVSTVRYGNISYNPAMFNSEMLNFAANSHVLLPQKDGLMVHHQESAPDHGSHGFAKASGDPQNCGNWKSIGSSQQSCDWMVNYSSGLSAGESNQNHPLFVGEGLTSSVNANNHLPSPAVYLKSSFNGYQDVNPSSEVSSQNNSQKNYGEIHFSSSSLYQNNPLAGVTSSMAGTEGLELASLVHQNSGRENELLLLPTAYGNQSNQWSSELGFLANKSNRDLRMVASDSNTQGLSLSLSPGLPTKPHNIQFGENLHSGTGVFHDHHGSRACLKSEYSCFNSKPSSGGDKVFGNACQDVVGSSAIAHRNSGPLGPFTGYATILKGSKFLKPAQQLLDEICFVTSAKSVEANEVSHDRVSNKVRGSADAVNASESMIRAKGGDSGVSSSTFYGSNEISGDGGVRSSSGESSRPEYQHKKAKLLFMQDEVCRRYKQYHQQMQMVVSSFELVAGLSAAAPYISLALKTVSRHFRCLRIAISEQLKNIRKALGEDFSSPATGASSSKGATSSSRLKFFDHSFTKQKSSGGGTLGFFEPQQQQHIWRPQRGLPERAVAVLRAWLFEHFLHPYPTDSDKHILATQTGLSRNQVSNWFINARVRVWKPMVEEIHMLETKGLAEPNSNAGKINDGNPTTEDASRTYDDQSTNKFSVTTISGKQVESFQIGSLAGGAHGQNNVEQWNQEKRSRVECQIPAGAMDGSLMGFVPYQRGGLEMGGLGAVSLTLGLRQSAEGAQQQQQLQQQQEHQLRQHFGGQMIHDFVG